MHDFSGAELAAEAVQHVVDAAHDAEVSVLVAARAVAREVILALELRRKVALLEALRIAPDGADDSPPRALDDENSALALLDVVAGLVHDRRHDSGQRHRAGARLQGVHAGERRDQMAAGFGLPPGVDDRAALVADGVVVPHPRFGIDRLTDGAEDAQRFQIVFLRKITPRSEEHTSELQSRG